MLGRPCPLRPIFIERKEKSRKSLQSTDYIHYKIDCSDARDTDSVQVSAPIRGAARLDGRGGR